MRKMMMVLMMVFGLSVAAFADVTLMPKDAFNNDIVPAFEDTAIQPQIAYFADTWEDVYKKTGVSKYGWTAGDSKYSDKTYQHFLIIKCKDEGGLWWICFECPGDGSATVYVADAGY